MCVNCCSKQKIVNFICGCSSQKIGENLNKNKENKKKEMSNECTIQKCSRCFENPITTIDSSKMCTYCYSVQAIKTDINNPEHELSMYDKELLKMDPVLMARTMLSMVGEMHIK